MRAGWGWGALCVCEYVGEGEAKGPNRKIVPCFPADFLWLDGELDHLGQEPSKDSCCLLLAEAVTPTVRGDS